MTEEERTCEAFGLDGRRGEKLVRWSAPRPGRFCGIPARTTTRQRPM